MVSADSPHGHTDQCILALETEIRRLSELVKRVRAEDRSTPGNAHTTDSSHRKVDKINKLIWMAAVVLEAVKGFRRLKGHKDLSQLLAGTSRSRSTTRHRGILRPRHHVASVRQGVGGRDNDDAVTRRLRSPGSSRTRRVPWSELLLLCAQGSDAQEGRTSDRPMMASPEPVLLTVDEVGTLLRTTRKAIYAMIAADLCQVSHESAEECSFAAMPC